MASPDTPISFGALFSAGAQRVQRHPVVTVAVLASLLAFILTLQHVNRLRRPIPGIPYNAKAISYVLGDIPEFIASPNPEMWWAMEGVKHKSPMTQTFMRPFQQPWVLISDPWLSADILNRRAKEFDRSDATIELFDGVIPGHHITLKSTDPHFKKNKDLIRELMTPSFINQVTAPSIYHSVLMVIDLWYRKLELAGERPFDGGLDIHHTAVDIILAASFGFGEDKSQIAKEIRSLEPKESSPTSNSNEKPHEDSVFEFQSAPLDESIEAFTVLIDSLATASISPSPRLYHFLYRNLSPMMRKAAVIRDRLRNEQVTKSLERRASPNPQRCALDQLLTREDAIAAKEGREPNHRSQTIMSELLGYLGAGHETTSAVLRWAMCYLVQSQDIQQKLRDTLHAIYPEARQQGRRPSLEEILKTTHPFFDAVVEETLRCGMVLPLVMRQAVVDTQILGIPIPKGTSIMMFGMGPGLTVPSVKLDDKNSQERLEAFRQKIGSFDEHNLGDFVPERWLKTTMNKDGQEETVFNPNAGPAMAFGQGPRGCFGKRMALVEIKIFLTLVIWSFELLPLGPNLSELKETLGFTRYPTNVYLKLRKLD